MIQYSRHAKRRMQLYNITEDDIRYVVDKGEKDISLGGGKTSITYHIRDKFKYPIRVIGI